MNVMNIKQKLSTIMCIALLALQLNALVSAEEERTVSSGDLTGAGDSGELVGEGLLWRGTVSENDQDNAPIATVSGGDLVGEGYLRQPTVSDGELVGEGLLRQPTVSEGDVEEEPMVSGGDQEDVSAGDVSGDVSDGDAGDSVSSGDVPEEPVDLAALAMVKLRVPCNLNFVMDPWEICGRGSVWSRKYEFCNSGDAPLKLDLSDIKCDVRDGVVCAGQQVSKEEVAEAAGKVVQLRLVLDNGDVLEVTEESNDYEVFVKPGESVAFTITGVISNPRTDEWQTGDISIAVTYRAVASDMEG